MDEELIEVAPGLYQTKEDYEANLAYDEYVDEQLIQKYESDI